MCRGVPDTEQTNTAHKTSYHKSELNSHAVLLQGETFSRKSDLNRFVERMSLHRSTSMSGKIVECHVNRIKGQRPVFTGTQVFR